MIKIIVDAIRDIDVTDTADMPILIRVVNSADTSQIVVTTKRGKELCNINTGLVEAELISRGVLANGDHLVEDGQVVAITP